MDNKIAIIGLACRFPGARNLEDYWNNLISGKDTIKHFTEDELKDFEYDFNSLRNNPDYIKTHGILDDVDKFDAAFFGMTPKEAAGTDPQHRIWLETAWDALENAGCNPFNYKGAIGVFAGGSVSTYLLNNVLRDSKKIEDYIRLRSAEAYQILTGNDPSFISTKTAYKFNLKGPAINVQTACSTSLVAIAQACQSLYSFESDLCLAGGVCINIPQERGYIYQEGGILSSDGICSPFDSQAKGTVPSNGIGVVVLKRMEDALRDNDTIYAVVSGWALNNDGSNKVSYTAPSVDGQAEVIKMAQSFAEVSPEDICYIEAHGTATKLGDPIEFAALTKAFFTKTDKKQYCGIGSVKSNIGHTDVAAGVASFIKVCLAAYYKKIPATLHFSEPNPHIDFKNSPFFIQKDLREWTDPKPLIMGVSSFGIGGTNAHVIIEEPPIPRKYENVSSEWPELILVSAKSENSLNRRKQDLIEFTKNNPDLNIRDVSYSLETCRSHMKYRSFTVVSTIEEMISSDTKFTDGKTDDSIARIAFMFPGQGAQYVSMGYNFYQSNKLFREILDECFAIVESETGEDLKNLIFQSHDNKEASVKLSDTEITQPALFIIEYALARVLMQLDITPSYLIGHSIGEYTAACIAGVFDLQSALKIVIMRGKLMQKMPRGEMMVARIGKDKLESIKENYFEIAADNANECCTISFKPENSVNVKRLLDNNAISYIPLNTSHAFHSSDFDPILDDFTSYVNQFNLNAPKIPFISCLTGDFITVDQATSSSYWSQQLRNLVFFRKGISTIAGKDDVAFLEVGPNNHLSPLVKQNESIVNKKAIIQTLGKADKTDERYRIITAIGNLFNIGVSINFEALHIGYKSRKISLPTYPFEKTRCWIDSVPHTNYKNEQNDIQQNELDIAFEEISKTTGLTLTPIQSTLVHIWKDLFGIKKIDINDVFYDIGGHSLLALQIKSRIKETFKVEISLKDFLGNATILKISEIIQNKLGSELEDAHHGAIEKSIQPIVQTSNLPLSNDQLRLWFITIIDHNNPAYNIPYTLKLIGNLEYKKFKQAVEYIIDRHQVFKTKIILVNGEPKVFLDLEKKSEIKFLDWTKKEIVDENAIQEFLTDEVRESFIFDKAPLYRCSLVTIDSQTFILHLTVHHVIIDGWSWGVFNKELNATYNSLVHGCEISLPELKIQYYDYTSEVSKIDKTWYTDSLEYWKIQLKGVPKKINFPWDKARPEIISGTGGHESLSIPFELSEKLRQLSKKENVSLFTTIYASFVLLLHKYSSDEDICVGVPVANRNNSDYENLIGLFVNTVILRANFSKPIIFTDFLKLCGENIVNALTHPDLPFEKLVNELEVERNLKVNPIFQVMLTWLSTPYYSFNFENIMVEPVAIKETVSPLDLALYVWDNEGRIEGNLEYSNDVLTRTTIQQFKENYLRLLNDISENPNASISDISVMSDTAAKFLNEYNSTEVPIPDLLLHDLFSESAQQNWNKTAVQCKNDKLTYKELDKLSNQVANYLISNGLQKGEAVGISLHRNTNMLVAVLGILKAGAYYLPLDPKFPDERLNYMLEDSSARFLITQNELLSKYDTNKKTILLLDSIDEIQKQSEQIVNIGDKDQDLLAYIIYTSGSTGKPKGVKVHHRAVVNFIQSMSKVPGIKSSDVLLAVTTLSFDISVLELFLPLSYGATIVLASSEESVNGKGLTDMLNQYKITQMQATPATWNMLINSGWKGKADLKALCGGEAMSPNLAESVLPLVESLWNMYGPTETTVWSTCMQIKDYTSPISVGKPLDNTTIYIVDKFNKKLPVGVYGEVIIGGKGVTKGYHNREELTNEKFIWLDDELVYKTGDNGRIRLDGNLEISGRVDNQIKLRGFRIEPGEIEACLCLIEGIQEAVVKVHKLDEVDERLVAFIRTENGIAIPEQEIRNQIGAHLPGYMVPSSYQFMSSFPKTPNNKTDRKALTIDKDHLINLKRKEVRALTNTEQKIYEIWSEVLKTKDILITDNFFEIGGNSLLTIFVASKIEGIFNIDFNIRNFFSSPRLKDLAEKIDIKIKSNIFTKNIGDSSINTAEGEI